MFIRVSTEVLRDLVWESPIEDGDYEYAHIKTQHVGNSRWSSLNDLIFTTSEYPGQFFKAHYSKGLTEAQDMQPFEYEGTTVQCEQVFPHIIPITIYKNTPNI